MKRESGENPGPVSYTHLDVYKRQGNSFLMTLLFTGVLVTTLFIFLDPILLRIGATKETFPYAKEFLLYYLPGNIFLTMCFNFNSMMRASGYPQKAMYTMLIGVIANIIIAPIFIFWFEWGIKGAAIATIISMFIGLCFVCLLYTSRCV